LHLPGSCSSVWSSPALLQPPFSSAASGGEQYARPSALSVTCFTCFTSPQLQPVDEAQHQTQQQQPFPLKHPNPADAGRGPLSHDLPEQQPCPGYVLAASLQPVLSSPGSLALHLLPRHLVCYFKNMCCACLNPWRQLEHLLSSSSCIILLWSLCSNPPFSLPLSSIHCLQLASTDTSLATSFFSISSSLGLSQVYNSTGISLQLRQGAHGLVRTGTQASDR